MKNSLIALTVMGIMLLSGCVQPQNNQDSFDFADVSAKGGIACLSQSPELAATEYIFSTGEDGVMISLENYSDETMFLDSDCVQATDGIYILKGGSDQVKCVPTSVSQGETFLVTGLDGPEEEGVVTDAWIEIKYSKQDGSTGTVQIVCNGTA